MNNDLLGVVTALPAVSYYPVSPVSSEPTVPSNAGESAHNQALKPWYVSPNYEYDIRAQVLVVQFRNSETGRVTEQIPSEEILEKYRLSGGASESSAISDTTA